MELKNKEKVWDRWSDFSILSRVSFVVSAVALAVAIIAVVL